MKYASAATLALCLGIAGSAVAQEDRNLAIQKTLYTKIRNNLTLGQDEPSSLFVMLNPGIPLDPAWDLSRVADRQKLARLLGRAMKPTWLYRPASMTVESIYSDVLGHHNTGTARLTATERRNLEDQRREAKAILYRDNQGTHTALYDRYLKLKGEYDQALLQLENARQKAEASGTPLDPKYQNAVDAYYSDWTGVQGQKDVVEGAIEAYRQVNEILNPSAWWTELRSQHDSNMGVGPNGRFAPVVLDDDYKSLFLDSNWMDVSIADSDVSTTSYHEHTSTSVGGSAGWGLWSIHVGGNYEEDKGHSLSDAKGFNIAFQVRRTGITYPWMNTDVFYNRGWRWAPGWGGVRLSDGGALPSRMPKGRLALLPVSLVLSRNVVATGTWNTTEVTTFSSRLNAGGSVGWGPFSIGGSYSRSVESGTAHGQISANGFTAPDVQIIGMFCDVVPRSPFPDETLEWTPALTAKDIDGGGEYASLRAKLALAKTSVARMHEAQAALRENR